MNRTFYTDLAERAVRTFLQATLAVIAADLANVTSVDAAKTVLIAAVAAGLSAVMSMIGRNVGPSDNPAILNGSVEPTTEPVEPPGDQPVVPMTDPNQPPLSDDGFD